MLANLDSLGAGFQLASHDLDIRGAGNLLGDEQSGHIKEVGFELYQSMLEDAILELKSGVPSGARSSRRRSTSRRRSSSPKPMCPTSTCAWASIAGSASWRIGGVEAFGAELIDRFGKLAAGNQEPAANR